jgi:phosphatidylglycerophosphatase A
MNRAPFDPLVLFFAQGAGAGRAPRAPGTAGTAVGLLLYLLLKDLGPAAYGAASAAVAVLGAWAAGRAEVLLGRKDDPSIVIDEIAGFLTSLFLVPAGWGYAAAAFMLFRFFDIVKPWPIRRLQDLPGGVGVMADDIAAGVCTNLVLQLFLGIAGRA